MSANVWRRERREMPKLRVLDAFAVEQFEQHERRALT